MIYCPNCGTANRDGSSFCNQCGHRLGGGSKTTCPFCGAENPIENIFCDTCGAKLAPLVTPGAEEREKPGPKGLSLPTKPLEDGDEQSEEHPEPSAVPSGAEDEEEIPDWLARLRASLGEAGEAETEEAPTSEEPEAERPAEEVPQEELPDWLRKLGAPPAEEGERAEGVAEAFAAEAAGAGEALPEEELPDWLQDLSAQPVGQETGDVPVPPAPEEQPQSEALLAEPAPMEAQPKEAAPEEQPPPEALAQGVPALSEPEQVPAEEQEPLAAWLQAEGPVILELSEEETAEAVSGEPPPRALGPEIPAWLETLASEAVVLPEELGPTLAPPGKPTPEEAGLERAAIPSWLEALRPGRTKEGEEESPAEEPVETEGVLEGVRGALRWVPAVDPEPGRLARAVSEVAAVTPAHAETMSRVLAQTTAASVGPQAVPVPRRERGLPWLAFLLLLAAVLIPIFAPNLVPGGDAVPVAQPVADFARQVQDLQPGAVVLLSLDYDPSVSTELDWPVREVVAHLQAKGVRLLVMSTTPTGPGLAARMGLGEAATLLGYLPGQETGLQRLATSFADAFLVDYEGREIQASALGVQSLGDVALIIPAAASQEAVRWWVEQVGSQVDTPICAIVSGAAEPLARPYYASGQLSGLVSGWVGGLAYRQATSPEAPIGAEGKAAIEAQSLGHLAIVVLIVLGNLAYWGKRLLGERP